MVLEDDKIDLYLGPCGQRLYVHCTLKGPRPIPMSSYKHYMDVLMVLQMKLKERNINTIYTYVNNVPRFRFAEIMGFQPNLEMFETTDGEKYEIMKKVFA